MTSHVLDFRATLGHIHSTDSFGAVDGPGIRFVVFMQGCLMRCLYCHNPDTWDLKGGHEVSVGEIVDEIQSVRHFIQGVTITGGEPLLQAQFVYALIVELKKLGLHVAIDSNGFVKTTDADKAYKAADLVLLDLKSIDPHKHIELTGVSHGGILERAKQLSEWGIPLWIRYVLVPGWSDNLEDVYKMAQFIKTLDSVQKVEVLPFHKMGEYKWKELGLDYKLENTPSPSREVISRVKDLFLEAGLELH